MDIVWIVTGGILMIAGIAGCLLPFIPGPPLTYFGLLALQLQQIAPFSTRFLIIWALIVIAITVADYLVPVYGTQRFGGTRYGIWGCTLGLIVGFWLGPAGIIAGPLLGAFLGEWIGHQNADKAFKAAFGSFIGFLFGTLLKLVASVVMCYYFVNAVI